LILALSTARSVVACLVCALLTLTQIGVARRRGVDIITNEVSNRATPSLIAFGPKQRAIGEPAKTQETSNFRNTVGSLKRLIGRSLDDPLVHSAEQKFLNAALVDVAGSVGVEVFFFASPLLLCSSTRRSLISAISPSSPSPSSSPPTSARSVTSPPTNSKQTSPISSSPSQAGTPISSAAPSSMPPPSQISTSSASSTTPPLPLSDTASQSPTFQTQTPLVMLPLSTQAMAVSPSPSSPFPRAS